MSRDPIMARVEITICVIAAVIITYLIFGHTFFSLLWSIIR